LVSLSKQFVSLIFLGLSVRTVRLFAFPQSVGQKTSPRYLYFRSHCLNGCSNHFYSRKHFREICL